MIHQVVQARPWLTASLCVFLTLSVGCERKAEPPTPKAKGPDTHEPKESVERDLARVTLVGKAAVVVVGLDASGTKPENSITVGSPRWSFDPIDFSEQPTTPEQATQLGKAEAVVADIWIAPRNGRLKFAGRVRVRTEADPPFGTVVAEGEATHAEFDEGGGKRTVLALKNGKLPILVTGEIGVEKAKCTGEVRVTGTLSTGKNGELLLSPEKVEQVKK